MKSARALVLATAAALVLSLNVSRPAHAQFGGGGFEQMQQFAPMLEMLKKKMGKKRFGQMMQMVGPMMSGEGGGIGNLAGMMGGGSLGGFDAGSIAGMLGGNIGGNIGGLGGGNFGSQNFGGMIPSFNEARPDPANAAQ